MQDLQELYDKYLGISADDNRDDLLKELEKLIVITPEEISKMRAVSPTSLPNQVINNAEEVKYRMVRPLVDERKGLTNVLNKRLLLLYAILNDIYENKAGLEQVANKPMDSAPIKNSDNYVKSGGVYKALDLLDKRIDELGALDVENLQETVGNNESGLVKDVNDLKSSVGNEEQGLVKDVLDLQEAIGTNESGTSLSGRVTNLEDVVGDDDEGLVKGVSDLKEKVGDFHNGLVKDVRELTEWKNNEGTGNTQAVANLQDAVGNNTQNISDIKEKIGTANIGQHDITNAIYLLQQSVINLSKKNYVIVDTLPVADIENEGKIYLVRNGSTDKQNYYDEKILIKNANDELVYEEIGILQASNNADIEALIENALDTALENFVVRYNTVFSHPNVEGNPHKTTKSDIGLDKVVNASQNPNPVENGTEYFTTGGAYTLLQSLINRSSGSIRGYFGSADDINVSNPQDGDIVLIAGNSIDNYGSFYRYHASTNKWSVFGFLPFVQTKFIAVNEAKEYTDGEIEKVNTAIADAVDVKADKTELDSYIKKVVKYDTLGTDTPDDTTDDLFVKVTQEETHSKRGIEYEIKASSGGSDDYVIEDLRGDASYSSIGVYANTAGNNSAYLESRAFEVENGELVEHMHWIEATPDGVFVDDEYVANRDDVMRAQYLCGYWDKISFGIKPEHTIGNRYYNEDKTFVKTVQTGYAHFKYQDYKYYKGIDYQNGIKTLVDMSTIRPDTHVENSIVIELGKLPIGYAYDSSKNDLFILNTGNTQSLTNISRDDFFSNGERYLYGSTFVTGDGTVCVADLSVSVDEYTTINTSCQYKLAVPIEEVYELNHYSELGLYFDTIIENAKKGFKSDVVDELKETTTLTDTEYNDFMNEIRGEFE